MDPGPIITATGAILTAAIAAFGTVYVARAKTRTDISSSITAGFEALTNQLQEERKELLLIIDQHREAIDKHRLTIEKLFNENEELREERRALRTKMETLEQIIRIAGLTPAP